MTRHMRSSPVPDVPEQDWVADMREHFVKTGTYRQSDLERVLGKPWDTVKVDASGHLQLACGVFKGDKNQTGK
jgi:hypothetical protein